ncbi:hypothetical protein H4R18_005393 [Coemansia javaensis]|uniref:Uncharacterized protein n=1 Tax=Coemansia javaensis TaxID=2761396 RepID=A0A9W8LFM9_9FUNG|nr:hypothetical protein H4R18_005393 [Coemansia javaensis]
MSASHEVAAHLRVLRASCARGLAWCSALIWAEKAFLLTDGIDDLLWLADALVTNGQYRQAEELLASPAQAARVRASAQGRYLAAVVAMRLGRAEDALALLAVDADRPDGAAGGRHAAEQSALLTPTARRPAAGAATLDAALPLPERAPAPADEPDQAQVPPLNPRAWALYMQGAAVVQLSNVGASEETPSIRQLGAQHPRGGGHQAWRLGAPGTPLPGPGAGGMPVRRAAPAPESQLGGMDALVARLWKEAVWADARCWEAWTGLRDYGLLTSREEAELVDSVDWAACCGGSAAAGRFFRSYCLATQTAFSLGEAAVDATGELLSLYPRMARDPALRTIQAARLLSLGRARECLEHTVGVLEHRRVPDPSATAIHITALTVLHAKDALFRIAHELSEEFGLSAVKRPEIEPGDTGSLLPPGAPGPEPGSARASGIPASTPQQTQAVGSAVAGTGRLRAGARGLLVPETPSKAGPGSAFASAAGGRRRQAVSSGAAHAIARSVVQSAPATAAAAWRGLWGLPTWTRPGPPVLATYPSALGPVQAAAVSTDASVSTLGIFTTSNAQSVGGPTQYEFIGASLAWYAIGCYYLVSAALMAHPGAARREWPLVGALYAGDLAGGLDRSGGAPAAALRRVQPLTPEAEHALAEARRWLAKTTLASPRSVVAWVAFAHTFVVAGEWESATRALHTAVGLCGCEGIIHGGGRDSAAPSMALQTPSKHGASADIDLLSGARDACYERGSQLAYAPLASLGSVYLQMGDLGMAESCLDASARCLSGYRICDWLSAWGAVLDQVPNSQVLDWCASEQSLPGSDDPVQAAAVADPQLLNDIGVLYCSSGELANARRLFILALASLNASCHAQHALYGAFSGSECRPRAAGSSSSNSNRGPPEVQASSALFKANLGCVLRRMGDHDAALQCLQAAAAHAPADTDIALSVAFTLHSRAIERRPQSPAACDADLDQAIDMYHQILSDRPGDSTTTDLLALALELSITTKDVRLLGGPLEPGEEALADPFALRTPDEIGLLDRPGPGLSRAGSAALSEQGSQSDALHTTTDNASPGSQQSTRDTASTAEDSDEVMDIEDDSAGSESDMAVE